MESLESWSDYIRTLAGRPLLSKAIACNTHAFASDLLAEGYTMADVREIMVYFARQLCAVGMKAPEGGAFDLLMISMTDPICIRTPPMSEAMADQIARDAEARDMIESRQDELETT